MGRGPQPLEPPGRVGVSEGSTLTVGEVVGFEVGATLVVTVGVDVPVFKKLTRVGEAAEAFRPKPTDRTRANPMEREMVMIRTPEELGLRTIPVDPLPGICHTITYRQIYHVPTKIVKSSCQEILKDVDFTKRGSPRPKLLIMLLLSCFRNVRIKVGTPVATAWRPTLGPLRTAFLDSQNIAWLTN